MLLLMIFSDLTQLLSYFFNSGLQSDKTGFIAPRVGWAKRRAAQAVNLRSSSRTPLKIIDSVSKAKQLDPKSGEANCVEPTCEVPMINLFSIIEQW